MSDAWIRLVSLDGSDEHLKLCDEAMVELQKRAHVNLLRLVGNLLAEMEGSNASTMDMVEMVNRARDLVMKESPGVDLGKRLRGATDRT